MVSFFVFLFLLSALIPVSARAESLGFTTEPVSEKDFAALSESLKLSMLSEEPPKQKIVCFDVDGDGRLLLGLESHEQKCICVCDPEGSFRYAIAFKSSGSFALAWDGSNIVLFLARSKTALTVDPSGEIIRMVKIENTAENDRLWREILSTPERVRAEKRYQLRNESGVFNRFAGAYSQLVMTDASGESTVLYDTGESTPAGMGGMLVLAFALAAICILAVKEYRAKKMQKADE